MNIKSKKQTKTIILIIISITSLSHKNAIAEDYGKNSNIFGIGSEKCSIVNDKIKNNDISFKDKIIEYTNGFFNAMHDINMPQIPTNVIPEDTPEYRFQIVSSVCKEKPDIQLYFANYLAYNTMLNEYVKSLKNNTQYK